MPKHMMPKSKTNITTEVLYTKIILRIKTQNKHLNSYLYELYNPEPFIETSAKYYSNLGNIRSF